MPLRLVVCGDDNVGKSSLIACFLKDEYVAYVPGRIQPVTVSKEDYKAVQTQDDPEQDCRSISEFLPEQTVIVDTRANEHHELNRELKQADVILLVYLDHYTYERLSLHWLPMFREKGVNVPTIVCENKCDSAEKSSLSFKHVRSEEFMPLITEFKEIEACVRCSAKKNANVAEVFYLCQRAYTHPISPIFDSKEGNLKPDAVQALKRIFFLCDGDQDGVLNFKEFFELHMKSFLRPTTLEEFRDILIIVDAIILPEDSAPIAKRGISENAFIILNKKYAEEGRHETIWGMFRAFQYTNSLSLNDRFLYPKIEVSQDSSVELSPTGYRFFVDLFVKFDKDNDGGLSEKELNDLFTPTPGLPKLWKETQFPSSIVRTDKDYVSLQGWLAQWNLTTFLDHKTTLEYLAYLGFDEDNSVKAIKVTKSRKYRKRQGRMYRGPVVDRNVFNCYVIGAPKSGKTSLLELFIRGTYREAYLPTIKPKVCIKDIELRGGKQCYLILEELGELESAILENQKRLDQCDVICYTYDSSDPELFQYLVDLREKYQKILDDVPCVFAALKADLDKQQQRSDIQPENYTRDLSLSPPSHVSSSWTASLHEFLIQLVDAAKVPSTATPGLEPRPEPNSFDINLSHVMIAGCAVSVMAVASFWIIRNALRQS